MKLIVAIIRPEKLEAIQGALGEPGVSLMSVTKVADTRMPGLTGTYRGGEVRVPQPRLRLEVVVVNDALVQWVIEAITHAGSTGDSRHLGDGNVFVVPLEECVRIPGGESRPVAE
jgi:nitrogen regulatory protein P-II 1